MNTEVTLQIGIDWADQKHDYCLCAIPVKTNTAATKLDLESGVVASSPESLHQWITSLRERFPSGDFEVCLELSRGPLVNLLCEYDFIRIYPLNPISANRFRECLYPSLSKDDVKDAALLLEILQKHRSYLREHPTNHTSSHLLSGLVRARRKSVDQRTALVQQLTSNLKDYYPQALSMTGELSEPMSCCFLKKWPTWQDLSKARAQTLRKFYYGHRSRSEQLIEQRIEVHQNSCALTEDEIVLKLGRVQTLALIEQLETLGKIIRDYDHQIQELYQAHEKHALIQSLPGAGIIIGPRLLCAMEYQTIQCSSAGELSSYTGIAPVRQKSGNSSRISKRLRRPRFLHQTFIEWAKASIKYSVWAKEYYQHRRHTLGHGYWAIMRSLAFKWIRILYRCWESDTKYDEERYIQTLIKRGSPFAPKI